ncbi:MAG: hypothetical protein H6550_00105 [Chitinophagales bacterium]|nr:hypothetical protein [Chitinophagales bacterium]
MNRRLFAAYILLLAFSSASAQEVNLGLHFSPIATIPVMGKGTTTNYPALKARRVIVNASGGANINLRFGKMCIETGGNITTRSVTFRMKLDEYSYNNIGSSSSISSYSDQRSTGYAIAIPLQVGFLLDHHEEKTTYDLFGLLGASYEMHTTTGYAYGATTYSQSGTSVSNGMNFAPVAGVKTNWVNIIAGFKINAILRRVGLIDYGIRYHFPLSTAGKYHVETVVGNGTYGSVFTGDFYPHLSYIDFHITYYLLNLKGGEGIKHYVFR